MNLEVSTGSAISHVGSSSLPPDRVVCIFGMHRSGTSLVARIAHSLGVDLGPDEGLMAAHATDNPTGYWEHVPIVELNDRLLEAYGGTWDVPPLFADGWEYESTADAFRADGRAVLANLVGKGDVLGFKDPRMCLLVPFWNTLIPVTASILVTRHPFQVAASLEARDGFDSEHSAHLWARYVVAAWRNHGRRAVIGYEYTLADPLIGAAHLSEFLGLGTPSGATLSDVASVVDVHLNRHEGHVPDIGPDMALALSIHALIESQEFSMIDRVMDAIHEEWLHTV